MESSPRMRDYNIRQALHDRLLREYPEPDTIIKHEMDIPDGQRRLDVAVLNGKMIWV